MKRARRLPGLVALGAMLPAIALLLAACSGGPAPGIAEEAVAADEEAITRRLIEVGKRTVSERYPEGPQRRFNQPRHTGCLRADFRVEPELGPELRVGLFAAPRSYPAWIRFANATSTSDTEKDFRGMSIKLMRVDGPKLLGDGKTQDFILNSHPVLFVGNPADFLAFAERSLDSSPILFFLNPLAPRLGELRIALAGRRHHPGHLAIPYWSTTPYLFGKGRAVKYQARPCGGVTADEPDAPAEGYLSDAMRGQLASGGACFEFRVQLQTDPEAMPIEDATVEWDEAASPFRRVATIDIPPQRFETAERMELCENLAFNPWHSLPEHRPLGGLNRVRRELYRELAAFRHRQNSVAYAEPTGDEPL